MKKQLNKMKISELGQFMILILLLSGLSIVSSCNGNDDDEISVSVDDLTFELVMEETPYFNAEAISVSPNGQYIVASVRLRNSLSYFQSIDGGVTFSELEVSVNEPIKTNISNNGKFILQNSVVNLADGTNTGILQTSSGLDHFVTESGKVLSFQGRRNEVKLYEAVNGELIEIDVEINFDPGFAAGVSGEKIGFYEFQLGTVIREFDASTNTVTENKPTSIDYGQIGGGPFRGNTTKTVYSEGYFALAKEGGCLIISPNMEISYYRYPSGYANFMNTAEIQMLGIRIFVPLFKNTGEKTVFEIDGGELKETELSFPIVPINNGFITTGFIENEDTAFSGIIKYEDNVPTYLSGNINTADVNFGPGLGIVFEIGNYFYFRDKRYNINSKTYSSSQLNEISKVIYEDSRQIAFTSSGTFQSMDNGENWIKTENDVQPVYVVRDNTGTYYGMTISAETVSLGGTGFTVTNYGHKVYTSTDPASSWSLIPGSEKNNFRGRPQGLSSDGIVTLVDDLGSGLGNAILVFKISKDYGVTYESIDIEANLPKEKTSQFETKDGRKVQAFIALGVMELTLASLNSDACSINKIVLPPELEFIKEFSVTSDERLLFANREVYKSSKF